MKRGWESNSSAGYGMSSSTNDEPSWPHMQSHPYASAYSSIPNPFQPSPLHHEASFEGYAREPPVKRSRPSESGSLQPGSQAPSEAGDDDDEDDDDDEEGEEGGKGKKGKGAKGADGKGKIKLTRGSR